SALASTDGSHADVRQDTFTIGGRGTEAIEPLANGGRGAEAVEPLANGGRGAEAVEPLANGGRGAEPPDCCSLNRRATRTPLERAICSTSPETSSSFASAAATSAARSSVHTSCPRLSRTRRA